LDYLLILAAWQARPDRKDCLSSERDAEVTPDVDRRKSSEICYRVSTITAVAAMALLLAVKANHKRIDAQIARHVPADRQSMNPMARYRAREVSLRFPI
jgi:hypothetical protein